MGKASSNKRPAFHLRQRIIANPDCRVQSFFNIALLQNLQGTLRVVCSDTGKAVSLPLKLNAQQVVVGLADARRRAAVLHAQNGQWIDAENPVAQQPPIPRPPPPQRSSTLSDSLLPSHFIKLLWFEQSSLNKPSYSA